MASEDLSGIREAIRTASEAYVEALTAVTKALTGAWTPYVTRPPVVLIVGVSDIGLLLRACGSLDPVPEVQHPSVAAPSRNGQQIGRTGPRSR